jgi:hypothetical protein
VFLRIFVCSQSGNHPQEDSAKSGYEVQNFNHPSYVFGYTLKNQYKIFGDFHYVSLTSED